MNVTSENPGTDSDHSLASCAIVLVRTKIAANLGAVARVMRNLGYCRLFLVDPLADINDPRGRLLATHSEDILDQARIVPDLGEAVSDCGLVVGTSARTGGLFRRQSAGMPEEIMPHIVEAMRERPVALVFGPEDKGLSNAEVARCHYLIHFPTAEEHPSLNLAQAVAICLYELRRAWLSDGAETGSDPEKCRGSDPVSAPSLKGEGTASFADQERMFAELQSALEKIHFLYGAKAEPLMHAIRHLLGRARPTTMEVDVLLGLARQIQWFHDNARGQDHE